MTIFEKYGIPMAGTVESLQAAFYVYEVLVDNLTAETVSTADFESTVRADWQKVEASEKYTEVWASIQSLVWGLLDSEPQSSVRLYEDLGSLRSDVKDDRDYHVRMFARLNRPKVAVGEEFTEGKADAEQIKEYAENMANSLLPMFDPNFDLSKVEGIKVKKNKEGKVVLSLSRIPSGPRDSAGRKSATHNLRLSVNGERYDNLVVERVLHDVVSSGPNRITLPVLIKAVEDSGQTFSSKGWDKPVLLNNNLVWGICIAENNDEDTEDSEEDSED